VVYFSANFAKNMLIPVSEILPSALLGIVIAVSGYFILLAASWMSLDRRVDVAVGLATMLSLLIAGPLYSGAFYTAQDGEFAMVFVEVGLITICMGVPLALFAALLRKKNNSLPG